MDTKLSRISTSVMLGLALTLGNTAFVFAQTPPSTPSAKSAARMTHLKDLANKEITRRLDRLTTSISRIGEVKKISDSEKSSLSGTLQGEITDLTTLKAKIDADTDVETMASDTRAITKSYRIFVLIIPRSTITAAADRVLTIVDAMNTLGSKFKDRIATAQSAGKNVTAVQTQLSDFTSKVTDASTQAQAALTEIAPLVPDNGNQTQLQANTKTLQDARSKIRAATEDLRAARKDAGAIVKALQALGTAASSTSPDANKGSL